MPKNRPVYVHTVSGPDMVKALQVSHSQIIIKNKPIYILKT